MKKFDYRKLTTKFKQYMIESQNEYTMFLFDKNIKYKFGNVSLLSSFVGEYGFGISVACFRLTDANTKVNDEDKIELFFNIIHTDDTIDNIKLIIISDDVQNSEQLKQDVLNSAQDKDIYNLASWISSNVLPMLKKKLKSNNQVFTNGIRKDFIHLDVDENDRQKLLLMLGEYISKIWLSKNTFKSAKLQGK